jgi:membrane protease YdiL (CAAX protease family)
MTNLSKSRNYDAIEALLVFAIVMIYIWRIRAAHPFFWIVPFALILASQAIHGERPSSLGFRTAGFGDCLAVFGPAFAALAITGWIAGSLLRTIRPQSAVQMLASFAVYLPWGLFQQYLMNGYFLRRLETAFSRTAAGALTSALFCAAHAPNWFLMLITAMGAPAAIWVYRRYGNLWFLGLAHTVLGFVSFMIVPDSISHHLRVGPGWYPGADLECPSCEAQSTG